MKTNNLFPRRAASLVVLLLALLLMLGGTTRAESETDHNPGQAGPDACLHAADCMALVNRAHKEAQTEQLTSALADYEAAHKRWQAPWLLFNIGRILHRLKRWQEAATFYERYLANDATESAEQRELASKYLGQVNAELSQRTSTAAATVLSPAAVLVQTPNPPLGPGRHPMTKKWWLWTLTGIVAAGAIAGVVVGTQPSTIGDSVPRYRPFE